MRFIAVVAFVGLAAASDVVGIVSSEIEKSVADLKAELAARTSTEEEEADSFATRKVELENTIKVSQEKGEKGRAQEAKGNADADEAQAAKSDALNAAANKKEEMEAAAKKCRAEKKNFAAEEADLSGTIRAIAAAINIIKTSQTNLLQTNGKMSSAVRKVVQGLSMVVEASSIEISDADQLKAFLQEDQPQATQKAYESQGGGIIGVLEEMQNKSEADLEALQKAAFKHGHECEMARMNAENTIKAAGKDADRNSAIATEAKASATAGSSAASRSEKNNADAKDELKSTTAERARQNNEFKQRSAEINQQMQDFGTAEQKIKEGIGAMFLQTKSDDSGEARQEVVSYLKKAAYKYHAVELAQVAVYAATDPFAKVKGLINTMIDRLQKKAMEEGKKQAWCLAEEKKSTDAKETAKERLAKYKGRATKASATADERKETARATQSEFAEANDALAAAEKARAEDKQQNTATVAECDKFIQGINGAIKALGNNDSMENLLSILRSLVDEKQQLKDETNAGEGADADAHGKMKNDHQVAQAEREATIKAATQEAKEMDLTVQDNEGEIQRSEKDLTTAEDALFAIDKECNKKPPTFEERQAKAKQEIDALENAIDILDNQ